MTIVRASNVPLLLTAALGITLSLATGWLIHRQQRHYFGREVQAGAENRFASIRREAESSLLMVQSVNGLIGQPQSLTPERFHQVAASILGSNTQHVVSWLPRVDEAGRADVERSLPRLGGPYSWFTELDPLTGKAVAAPPRAHYYPVLYSFPESITRPAIGFNTESRAVSRIALRQAAATRSITASGPVQYVNDRIIRVSVYAPVWPDGNPAAMPAGFVSAGLRTDYLVERALAYLQPVGMHIELWDDTDAREPRLLHRHTSRAAGVRAAPTAPSVSRTIAFANRTWRIVCIPVMPGPGRVQPLMASGAGLVITFFLVLSQRRQLGRAELIEVEVRQRTEQLQREIAERRRTEVQLAIARDEALEASRLKSEFLANVSHELRTPLNGVVGTTEMLLNSRVDEQQREWLEIVRESSSSLLHLISDVLDSSRMEAGGLRLEIADFTPESVLESTLDIVADRAHRKGLDLAGWVDAAPGATVRGDARRVRQVLLNLVSNAVKFTHDGAVTVRAATLPADGSLWRFEVTDTGIGIDAEFRKRLFQRFVQFDGTSTRQFGGTGLGLAISKQLVELMGGRIGVESEPGAGSTFWFELPLLTSAPAAAAASVPAVPEKVRVVVDAGPATAAAVRAWLGSQAVHGPDTPGDAQTFLIAPVSSPLYQTWPGPRLRLRGVTEGVSDPEPNTRSLHCPLHRARLLHALSGLAVPVRESRTEAADPARSGRILLVEDNAVNRKVALWMLGKLGFQADSAADGIEALAALRASTYDAVLMDCQMPNMDGYEATRALREMPGLTAVTPVIALTANAMQGDREQCLAAGMDDYIAKPLDMRTLADTLDRWVRPAVQQPPRASGVSL